MHLSSESLRVRRPRRVVRAGGVAVLVLAAHWPAPAAAQDDDAVILVAHPAFRDMDYRQTVLLAAPVPNGGHVGVILRLTP